MWAVSGVSDFFVLRSRGWGFSCPRLLSVFGAVLVHEFCMDMKIGCSKVCFAASVFAFVVFGSADLLKD